MSLHEKKQAMNELSSEGKGRFVDYFGSVYSSADVILKVEEIRNRACIN